METQLKFGLSQTTAHAPVWLVNITSVVALLLVVKHNLFEGLPLANEILKHQLSVWTDYILDLIQVLLAITVVFFGEHKN